MNNLKRCFSISIVFFILVSNWSFSLGLEDVSSDLVKSIDHHSEHKQDKKLDNVFQKLDELVEFQSSFEIENELHEALVEAYNSGDDEKLDDFFKNWNEQSQKMMQITYSNDVEKDVYEIFKVLYQPFDIEALSGEESSEKLNKSAKYVVLQNKIEYVIDRDNDFFTNEDSGKGWTHMYDTSSEEFLKHIGIKNIKKDNIKQIHPFRPDVNIDKKKVLYLTKDYNNAINYFLGKYKAPMLEGQEIKYEKLQEYIPVLCGHWIGWHLDTHPSVRRVLFNKDMNKAKAEYRVGYEGAIAELEKEDGVWKIIKTEHDWIE
ncbi:hypothetical protein R9X47_26590 [Wukongibacter baidiensis]|uniref:hypothetical protein n=1 Tax=Wukongibacter baidiensis TaxID=1723361 RepID=UPI003D7F5D54